MHNPFELNSLFKIGTLDNNNPNSLLLEIGDSFCIETHLSNKSVVALTVYTFDPTDLESSIQQIIGEISNAGDYEQILVSPAFPQSLLLPRKFYHKDSVLLKTIYDHRHWQLLQDEIHEWQVVNSYSMPAALFNSLKEYYPQARFIHTYSASLKTYNGFSADQQIAAHFISNQFRVVVKKDQQIQLVQTYTYTSPMDVVYFLLKICTEFSMTQEETQLVLSGFIEEKSALYRELYNYFLNIHFATASSVQLPEHQYPSHFFTSVHNLAACVS